MISIDGAWGEGGGQILRTSLALSGITKTGFRIYNIRKGRKKSGLLPQHLAGVKAAAKLCNAKMEGDKLESEVLSFTPGEPRGGKYEFDVAEERPSAGSITLVYQSILPILLFAHTDSEVLVKGGTHVPFSPPYDFFHDIFLDALKKIFGLKVDSTIIRYGFYPVGRGIVLLRVKPISSFPALDSYDFCKRGALKRLYVRIGISKLSQQIAEREMKEFKRLIPYKFDEEICEVKAPSPGNFVFIKSEYENSKAAFSSLGLKGKPAEMVAKEAAKEFLDYDSSEGFFDSYLADQILLFLALTKKPIKFTTNKITSHLKTNAWVVQQFLKDVRINIIEKDKLIEINPR